MALWSNYCVKLPNHFYTSLTKRDGCADIGILLLKRALWYKSAIPPADGTAATEAEQLFTAGFINISFVCV